MSEPRATVWLIGGGSGGHIYPNVAIAQRLGDAFDVHYVVSDRAVDRAVLEGMGLQEGRDWTAVPARGFSPRPRGLLNFWRGMRETRDVVGRLREERRPVAAVASGGFVSGAGGGALAGAGVPLALMSLDVKAGRANRWLAKRADQVFAVDLGEPGRVDPETSRFAPAKGLSVGVGDVEKIGYPLRQELMGGVVDAGEAREQLALERDRPTLLVFGGSQGGRSLNRAVVDVLRQIDDSNLQVLHVAGEADAAGTRESYGDRAKPQAADIQVVPYVDRMDLAWAAADLAICRAGAGSVAEAWANAVPTIFLPYPFHKDQHQRLNAAGMEAAGGAVIITDRIDPAATATELLPALSTMLDAQIRETMRQKLIDSKPDDGAERVAAWVRDQAGEVGSSL